MNPLPLFAILQALEDYLGDIGASWFEFWGACMEALNTADLTDF